MRVATVTGTVTSTVNHEIFDGKKLLVCELEHADGYLIAVDAVGAGVGERVLVLDEGTGARQIFGIPTGPIRGVVVGIVDELAPPPDL